MPTPKELLAEIETGPLAADLAPLVAARDFNGVASLLNAPTRTGPVPIRVLSGYCIVSGVTGTVLALVDTPVGVGGMTLEFKALLHTVRTLIQADFRLETADVTGPVFAAACDGLIAGGVITADQKAGMIALAANQRGRAEELWGVAVAGTDCLEACGGD